MRRMAIVMMLGAFGVVVAATAIYCYNKRVSFHRANRKVAYHECICGNCGDLPAYAENRRIIDNQAAATIDGQCAVCEKPAKSMRVVWTNITPMEPYPDPLVEVGVCNEQCAQAFRQGKAKGFRLNPDIGFVEQVEDNTGP